MSSPRRARIAAFVLLPAVLVAVGILTYFTFRTTLQLEKLRQQSVLEATLALASEKADRLDKRIVEEDNVAFVLADPVHLTELTDRWLPTAQRETPTVRAILILDEHHTVLAFASRAGGAAIDEEAFRRLLVQRMFGDMELGNQPTDELRHLHREYGGQSYLVSYWQRNVQGRRYFVVAWHDIGRIVKDALPSLYTEPSGAPAAPPSRANVVDEEGRIIFGPPLRSGEFTVGVRFPTTLYNWRLQVSPTASEELASRVRNRRLLELALVVLSSAVVLAGVVLILLAAERERRISALKSEFVANVSHELKTPLALIRMFGEMLQSGRVASAAKQQEYLDIIVAESERLSGLIENVLDFAKVERGRGAYDFAEGDVGAAVLKAVGVYRYRAEREGVPLQVEVQEHLPPARIDERAVQLAVINLLDNALKYAGAGGAIRVHVGHRPGRSGSGAAGEGGTLEVRVSDSGPGIPPDDRQRIFERFERGTRTPAPAGDASSPVKTPPVRGSGIGLSLVKHIIESHGGKAWVEDAGAASTPSALQGEGGEPTGSTFVLTIPVLTRSPREIS